MLDVEGAVKSCESDASGSELIGLSEGLMPCALVTEGTKEHDLVRRLNGTINNIRLNILCTSCLH